MSKVQAIQSTIRGLSNAVKRFAVKDKKFAEEIVYSPLKGEISKALKQVTKDMFQKNGKLSQSGKNEISSVIKELGLSKSATWDDILLATKKSKENLPKLQKIEIEVHPKYINVKELKEYLEKTKNVFKNGMPKIK